MNNTKKNVLLFWSGGKNSGLALTRLINNLDCNVVALVTLLDKELNAVRFHGISEALIVDQAKLLKIPNVRIYLDALISDDDFIELLVSKIKPFLKINLHGIAFGDTALEVPKTLKTKLCKQLGIEDMFPLWGESSSDLSKEFLNSNHHAIVSAIDNSKLDNTFLSKEYNQEWIDKLPTDVSAFGIKNEFHTFLTYSPLFSMRVLYSKAIAITDGPFTVTTIKGP